MTQAKRDIDAGLVDTDMRGTPGLDASLRAKLVPGPGGKPPGAKDPGMPKLEPAMTKTAELTARVEKMINSSAPKIWIALTTPATLKQFFFGANVVTDWKVGSPIRMQGEFKGKAYEDKGDILAFEPQRQLSFSHWSAMSGKPDTPANYHVVTFDLVPQGAATRVTLSQSNLTGGVTASDVEHRAEYEKNWSSVLDGLAKILS